MTERDLAELLRRNPDIEAIGDGLVTVDGWPVRAGNVTRPVPTKLGASNASNPVARLSEHDLQCLVIAECDRRSQRNPLWGRILHIPNGEHRTKATARRLKAMGVRAGALDLACFVPRHGYHGAFCELKATPNRPTAAQRDWIAFLQGQGYAVTVIWDYPELVVDWFEWYLEASA